MSDMTTEETKYFESKGEVAPVEKPEQAPAPEAETKPEEKAPEKLVEERKVVDHGAFAEERNKRKAAEKREAEKDRMLAEFKGKLDTLEKFTKGTEPAPPAPPAFDQDPASHLLHATKTNEEKLAELAKWRDVRETQEREQFQEQQFQSAYAQQAREFSQTAPDFLEAYKHIMGMREKELAAYGMKDPAKRAWTIHQEERFLVSEAMREGRNPAEAIYEMAKVRGYAKPEPKRDPENGQFQTNEKLKTIQEGQDRSKGLGNASGNAAPGRLTAEALLKMDGDDFAKLSDKDWKKLWA